LARRSPPPSAASALHNDRRTVVDTNIQVRGAIASNPHSAGKSVVDAIFAGSFVLILSGETLFELQRVLADEEIRTMHGWSDELILSYCRALEVKARMIETTSVVPPSLTRDVTDTKFVALAIDGQADYLVTHDQRQLGRLKTVGTAKIVTPAKFLMALKQSSKEASASEGS
jgi:putative PIN family toxin of toxin-antitoxin system